MARNRYLPDIQVKKYPRQSRSRLSFAALLEACAGILVEQGYEGVTTNSIAARAGVDIATLYEYFPNKESIIAELVKREFSACLNAAAQELQHSLQLSQQGAAEHIIQWTVEWMDQRKGLLSILWLDVPFVRHLPVTEQTLHDTALIIQAAAESDHRIRLADANGDVWLVTRMLFGSLLEICALPIDDPRRPALIREYIRICYRIAFG